MTKYQTFLFLPERKRVGPVSVRRGPNGSVPGYFLSFLLKVRTLIGENMDSEEGESPEISPAEESGGDSVAEEVMSEVHLGCPPNSAGPHISHFTILLPPRNEVTGEGFDSTVTKVIEVDEDGDLILTRRRDPPKDYFVITIQHNITSSIPRVGLQVWRAEMVLADFVLHMMHKTSELHGVVAVELGAGTGLVGMLLARVAKTVFITDRGAEVLENCSENVNLNAGIFHHEASVHVRELDWTFPWPPEVAVNSTSKQSYSWSVSEVEELQRASLVVAADVIYSDDLTDALFSILEAILSGDPEKVLYLALEKRYNFSLNDLNVVANGYSRFRSYVKDMEDVAEEDHIGNSHSFVGRRINLEEIPQYVQEYERGNDVEIWQIRYLKSKTP